MCCSSILCIYLLVSFFFFNDTATTEIYTLSLHDALPIFEYVVTIEDPTTWTKPWTVKQEYSMQSNEANRIYYEPRCHEDRKSTRLNSSHSQISYAVFCLKKKKKNKKPDNFDCYSE